MPSADAIALLEALPDAAWLTDAAGLVVAANARARAAGIAVGRPGPTSAPTASRRADGTWVCVRNAPWGDGALGIEQPCATDAGLAAAVAVAVDGLAHDVGNALNAIGLHLPILDELWRDLEPLADAQAACDPGWRPARLPWARAREVAPRASAIVSERSGAIAALVQALAVLRPDRPATLAGVCDGVLRLCSHRLRRAGATLTADPAPTLPAPPGLAATLMAMIDAGLRWCGEGGSVLRLSCGDPSEVTVAPGQPRPPPGEDWRHRLQVVAPQVVAAMDGHCLRLRLTGPLPAGAP